MKRLTWSKNLSVGIDEIDRQHNDLIDVVNDLYEGLREGGGKNTVARTLGRLEGYYTEHFQTEEKLMSDASYEGLDDHRMEHDEFRKRIDRFRAELDDPKVDDMLVAYRLVDYMSEWLQHHFLYVDMKYVKVLRDSPRKG